MPGAVTSVMSHRRHSSELITTTKILFIVDPTSFHIQSFLMKVTLVALFLLAVQTRAFLQPSGTQSRTLAALHSSCRFHDVLCESRRQIMGSWLATSFVMLPTMVQAKVRLWLFNCFFLVHISHVWLFVAPVHPIVTFWCISLTRPPFSFRT